MGARGEQLELPLDFRRSELVSHACIGLGGRIVSYTIKRRRRRRSISLTIDEHGLRVGAPWRASQRAIDNELRKHDTWILRKLAEWQERRAPPRRWQDGETLMLLGEPLLLALAPGLRTTSRDDRRLVVGVPVQPRPGEIAREVTAWMREQALACFRDRVAHYAPLLLIPELEIRLSNARTRWGSCHPDGRIHLNWRLIQMPLRFLDYVVVHELAHFREMNHSARFWQTVARVIPDYAARKREIRTEGHRYLFA